MITTCAKKSTYLSNPGRPKHCRGMCSNLHWICANTLLVEGACRQTKISKFDACCDPNTTQETMTESPPERHSMLPRYLNPVRHKFNFHIVQNFTIYSSSSSRSIASGFATIAGTAGLGMLPPCGPVLAATNPTGALACSKAAIASASTSSSSSAIPFWA